MSIEELREFLAPVKSSLRKVSWSVDPIEFIEFIFLFTSLIDYDHRSNGCKVLCLLPHLISIFTCIPMIALYMPYLILHILFGIEGCIRNAKDEAEKKLRKFCEESTEAFKEKKISFSYNHELWTTIYEIQVYGELRGEEAEREQQDQIRTAQIREQVRRENEQAEQARQARQRSQQGNNNKVYDESAMMMITMGNMINQTMHNFQENMERMSDINTAAFNLANISQVSQEDRSQYVRESTHQTSAIETKRETTATGMFKVNGWGCDALFLKTNATITRCNSKGDPSNTGEFLVVHTTSKPMSIRFESEGTWVDVPANSDQYFLNIPAQMLHLRQIGIEARYTPSC